MKQAPRVVVQTQQPKVRREWSAMDEQMANEAAAMRSVRKLTPARERRYEDR